MKGVASDCPEMSWLVMDAQKMDFPDSSFDLVFDKGRFRLTR